MAEQVQFREMLPKKGLSFTESQPQLVLCKPKLLPLKSFTLQRLEEMQMEAKKRSQEQAAEAEAAELDQNQSTGNVVSESVTFD